MPTFPRYESKGELTTRQPAAFVSKDTSGEITEAKGKVADTIQEGALKWSQAHDTIQKTVASANFKGGMADIQSRAAQDPLYNNSDQYYKEIEELKRNSLKGFTSKFTEMQTGLELGYEAKVGKIQIQNLYKKKEIDVGQMNMLKLIDGEVNNPNQNSLGNIQTLLNTQVASGIISHKDAFVLFDKANNDLGVSRINKDLNSAQTPEDVQAVKQGITSGAYEQGGVTIEPTKKRALLQIAESSHKNALIRQKAQAVEALAQNRMQTITDLASGKTRFDQLNLTDIAEYDPKLASTLNKVKDFMVNYNPELPPNEQALSSAGLMSEAQIKNMRGYARSVTDTFLQNDNKKLGDFILRELEKKGDGLTPSVKIAAFVNLAALKAKANNPQSQPDAEAADRFNAIKAGVKFLQASNPYLSAKAIGDFIVQNYISGFKGHEEVMQEAKELLRNQIIDRYQAVTKLPSTPNKIVDGEASVEDLQAGLNELKGEKYGANSDTGTGKKPDNSKQAS